MPPSSTTSNLIDLAKEHCLALSQQMRRPPRCASVSCSSTRPYGCNGRSRTMMEPILPTDISSRILMTLSFMYRSQIEYRESEFRRVFGQNPPRADVMRHLRSEHVDGCNEMHVSVCADGGPLSSSPSWRSRVGLRRLTKASGRSTSPATIPSGFFRQEDAEHISAVLFCNTGTIAKFSFQMKTRLWWTTRG